MEPAAEADWVKLTREALAADELLAAAVADVLGARGVEGRAAVGLGRGQGEEVEGDGEECEKLHFYDDVKYVKGANSLTKYKVKERECCRFEGMTRLQ